MASDEEEHSRGDVPVRLSSRVVALPALISSSSSIGPRPGSGFVFLFRRPPRSPVHRPPSTVTRPPPRTGGFLQEYSNIASSRAVKVFPHIAGHAQVALSMSLPCIHLFPH